MKIIVVGATGTIGAKVVEALSARHEVVGVARGTEVTVKNLSVHGLITVPLVLELRRSP